MNRLSNLDYLRGLAAFGIMIYHYLSWNMGSNFSADTFMGRFGIYGVSIFYVLSGLTLYYVYYEKMKPSKQEIIDFFKKRVFRIFPLLWFTTIIAILLSEKTPDLTNLFLNLTGLFGFLKWDTYFSAGVWSIGNELVFYVFFPFFILFIKRFKVLMVLFTIVIFFLYIYFAFEKLPASTVEDQWKNYVNPLNQVFLFLGGFFIGYFLNNLKTQSSFIITLLFLSLILFIYYPVSGDQFNIMIGSNRLVFTICCFLICMCFYKLTFKFPKFIHKPLTLLGEASYSIYLLHPIIYDLVGRFRNNAFYFPDSIRLILSILTTLLISYFFYQYFEKFFIKLGRATQNNPVQHLA
jgi:exopolysaccharide production protein ExoZ